MKRIEIKQPVGAGAGTYEVHCPKCNELVGFPTYRSADYIDRNRQKWWYGDCLNCNSKYKVGPDVQHLHFDMPKATDILTKVFTGQELSKAENEEITEKLDEWFGKKTEQAIYKMSLDSVIEQANDLATAIAQVKLKKSIHDKIQHKEGR